MFTLSLFCVHILWHNVFITVYTVNPQDNLIKSTYSRISTQQIIQGGICVLAFQQCQHDAVYDDMLHLTIYLLVP